MRKSFIVALMLLFCIKGYTQNPENWTSKELIEPIDLAASLKLQKDLPVVISVGPGAVIPGSLNVGMVNNKEGLDKLRAQLKNVDKQTNVVVYCGCCPFDRCPNVRPAISMLKEMMFTHYHLLNVPDNIKTDWIDKGYPVITP